VEDIFGAAELRQARVLEADQFSPNAGRHQTAAVRSICGRYRSKPQFAPCARRWRTTSTAMDRPI